MSTKVKQGSGPLERMVRPPHQRRSSLNNALASLASTAFAGLCHLKFRNVGFSLRFRNLLNASATNKDAKLDVLPNKIVLPSFKHQLERIRRKLGFGVDLMSRSAIYLGIEEDIRRTLTDALAVDPKALLKGLTNEAVSIKIDA